MTRAGAVACLALAGVAVLPAPASAQATLANAWMRPAYAGQRQAQVYVDVRAAAPLRLVGAASPVAKSAELVRGDPSADAAPRVVAELPIAGGGETRLAYLGSHVRLLEVVRDLAGGDRAPLALVFVDGSGERIVASTEIVVRGLMPRRPDGGAAPATR
ncbi:MAG: hypothetical protein BroJett026_27820 [Betaproteobacteria bacterium]|nr:MAG: hypothetical protein BroJett026_27820 [Betaproteobacteria bacterium]